MSIFNRKKEKVNRLWAIRENGCWSRWAPDLNRWEDYDESRYFIFADPTTGEACYYVNQDGSVHWRNIDKDQDHSYYGIQAMMISVGGNNRLWAIQRNGHWARWAPDLAQWQTYSEKRKFIFADPKTDEACYYVDPDGSVHWRNIDQNEERHFPGIEAKVISVGGDNRLWAIDERGNWARWAEDLGRWEIYSEKRTFIFAYPESQSTCYYTNPDGSVHWRNVDKDMERAFPGIKAYMISLGGK